MREFVHLHPSLQPTGRSWAEVRAAKSQWVREFSQYDAGWSYVGAPYPWRALADRSAIPNRVSTYVLAGLPVISDRRPGCYRYDELTRLDINIDLVDSDYEALACPPRGGGRSARQARQRPRRAVRLFVRRLDRNAPRHPGTDAEALLRPTTRRAPTRDRGRRRPADSPFLVRRGASVGRVARAGWLQGSGPKRSAVTSSDAHAAFRRTSGRRGEDRGHRALRGTLEALCAWSRDRSRRRGRGLGPRSRVDREDADSGRCRTSVTRVGIPPSLADARLQVSPCLPRDARLAAHGTDSRAQVDTTSTSTRDRRGRVLLHRRFPARGAARAGDRSPVPGAVGDRYAVLR